MLSDMPLTPGDLRAVAGAIDEIENTPLGANQIVGRIECIRPDGDDQIGWITRFTPGDPDMGWGFVPMEGE